MATSTTTLTLSTKAEVKDVVDESLKHLAQDLWKVNHHVSCHGTQFPFLVVKQDPILTDDTNLGDLVES